MAKITYNLSAFDSVKASAGALVVMVSSGYSNATITNVNITGGTEVANIDFFGAGICRPESDNKYNFTVNSIVYSFDRSGIAKSTNATGKKLMMAAVNNSISTTGNTVDAASSGSTTRSSDGDTTTVVENVQRVVDSLNARDNFALQALHGIFNNMKKDPATLSDNEMVYYCQQAYQWAANMMTVAASSRAKLNDTTATDITEPVEVGSFETNTEKLLNNIIFALERTDYKETIGTGDAAVDEYSERIINPKLNKLLEDLQETISNKKYERVTVYKLDDILTTLNTLNTTLTTGFANIVTALNTFTSNMNTRFTNVESAISSAKSDVISAMPSTSGLATSSDVSSAESAIIAAMPSCRYTPPSDNNT